MEPMNLGTPSNSGPSSPATPPSGSMYLPSFLLREPTSPVPGSTSPQAKRVSHSDFSHYASPRYQPPQTTPSQVLQQPRTTGVEKTSVPPIRGLYDTVSSPISINAKPTSEANQYISSVSRQFNESRTCAINNEATDGTWVTVFGYPPAAAAFILSQLSSCGNIVAREVPASGNWMHLQFSSKLEAKKALACNGKVYSGSVMVGVVPCRDQHVIDKYAEKSTMEMSSTSVVYGSPRTPLSPTNSIQPDLQRSLNSTTYNSPYGSPRISNVRNLATRPDAQVYGGSNTPIQSSGIVSKALDYILNW